MICPKCQDSGILNHANGIEFYYCRTCKIEISLEEAPAEHAEKESEVTYTREYTFDTDSVKLLHKRKGYSAFKDHKLWTLSLKTSKAYPVESWFPTMTQEKKK